MSGDEETKSTGCIECGWIFPADLIGKLIEGNPVYCEKCGKENVKENFNSETLQEEYDSLFLKIGKMTKTASKKFYETLKTKIQDRKKSKKSS